MRPQHLAATALILATAAAAAVSASDPLPWRAAAITERQAAVHLLNRFTFGPRPGDVDAVLEVGLEEWFEAQLAGTLPDREADHRTDRLSSWSLTSEEIAATYPGGPAVIREAVAAGVLPEAVAPATLKSPEMRNERRALRRWAVDKGYRPVSELMDQLTTNKVQRAVNSSNQLTEVLTDFWFNHFNVSVTDLQVRPFVLQYERDAIRPHVTSSFRVLLGSTARHAAMLLYLDNAMSVSDDQAETTMKAELDAWTADMPRRHRAAARSRMQRELDRRRSQPDRLKGLNENYARELLELHTLGVDGGYTQKDIVEVARAFTGWTVMPPRAARDDAIQRLKKAQRAGGLGFIHDGDFLFRADVHDADRKIVVGRRLPAGRGIEDGEEVLHLLASHPATARHIAEKLTVRFVSDDPDPKLVDTLAEVFLRTDGSVTDVLRAMVRAPEFWAEATSRSKVKTPLELAVSAVRAADGTVYDGKGLVGWIRRMGQPLYACQPPTGWPETADSWLGAGAVVARSTFAIELAAGSISGVRIGGSSRPAFEPSPIVEAIEEMGSIMLPEVDLHRIAAAVSDAEKSQRADREAMTLILASPDFQRR
jgi:uncharacterized protein (DUF1800 family)